MKTDWPEIKKRISAPSPDGKFPSVITGAESDDELRAALLAMTLNCCVENSHTECYLRPLKGLGRTALVVTLQGLSRRSLLEWIEDERQCRQKHTGKNCLTA